MENEAVAVGGEDERDAEGGRVVEALLEACAHRVEVVLGLDDGDGDVGFVVEDVVGAFVLAARDQLAADDDAALGEADFLADLGGEVPARAQDGGGDELRADVCSLRSLLFISADPCPSESLGKV